jgi:hypothetical protein
MRGNMQKRKAVKNIVIVFVFLSTVVALKQGVSRCNIMAYCQASMENGKYEISIFSDKNTYFSGEPVIVNADFKNNTHKNILIVFPQDGSENKFRYPYCYFEVLDQEESIVPDCSPACKVVNPLVKQAFRDIKPGKSESFFEDGFILTRNITLKPGRYRIRLFYSTAADKESQWYGLYSDDYWTEIYKNEFWKKRKAEMAENRKLLKKVPKLEIWSNTITIDIVEGNDISEQEALRIAEGTCKEEGWKFEDVKIIDSGGTWDVAINYTRLGNNGFIRIDKKNGAVLEKYRTGP